MRTKRESMSGVDTAWLRMESDTNLMMIQGVLILDRPLDMERFRNCLMERFLKFERFRQRVVMRDDNAWWELDPNFSLENHVHRVGLPGEGGLEALAQLASDLINTPLDFRRPLWQMHVVDGVGEGSAIITRIHHCIADGLALVQVLLSITDEDESAEPHPVPAQTRIERFLRPAQSFIDQSMHLGHELYEETLDLVQHPAHLLDLARKGMAMSTELAHIGLMPFDPPTRMKGALSGRKKVAWAPPLDLASVKAVAHALGGTVNDVLLSCASGALRAYLVEQGDSVRESIHGAIPFNLRPLDRPIETLGNRFGLVLVDMPIHIQNPLERFRAVQKHMRQLKSSPQPKVFYGMLEVLGRGPNLFERTALELLSKKASLVMTNVPGPIRPIYLAGARVTQPMVWVPQSGEVGVGLSILSYAGTVQFGVVADQQLLAEPDQVVHYFVRSFDELAALVPANVKADKAITQT